MARQLSDRVDTAIAALGDIAQRDVPLGPLTTYRVGGAAAVMVHPRSLDDLHRIAAVLAATELRPLVVGRGSNMLVADAGFPGMAIGLGQMATAHQIDGDQVVASATTLLPRLARRIAAESLTGFEWAVGVPGSVGGAVRMNAGGHGSDIAACLIEAHLFDLRAARTRWMPASELGLRFRGSDIGAHQVVVSARIQLAAGDRAASEREIDEIVRWRRDNQPGGQNAGSVFVNPIPGELSAGEVIDRAGLRGLALGTAAVSSKHANFIQASDGGRAADVVALIELVRARVADHSGFVLRSEVRLVGFEDTGSERDESAGVAV
jgi:UDP-N-acetylmuramate dehydrogenase